MGTNLPLSLAKGTYDPNVNTGLTLAEPAFNYGRNTLWIGKGSGVAPVWIAAGICGASSGIAAGLTYITPTSGAVKDYVTFATSSFLAGTNYVASFNGLTGSVSGVNSVNGLTGTLTISGGTGMSVLSGGKGITLVNTGVLSIDGSTGAITNVARTNVDNNFSAYQTINASGGGLTVRDTPTGEFRINPFNRTITYSNDAATSDFDLVFPVSTRVVTLPDSNTTLAGLGATQTFTQFNTFTRLATFNGGITAAGATFAGLATFLRGITASGLTVAGNGLVTGSFEVDGSLILPNGQTITGVVSSLNGLTGDLSVLASTGISVAAGGKGITLTNTGVQSFNGLTGAVSGVTTSVANTFTALQTFNAGITTSGITLNGPIVASGLGTFNAGISAGGTTAGFFTGTVDMNFNTLFEPTLRYYNETTSSPAISGNALTLDLSAAQVFGVTLNANINTLTISNTPSTASRAMSFTLIFTADGTARGVTWGSAVKWANGTPPTLTSTNAKKDVFTFMTTSGGSEWLGFVAGQNF